MPVLLTTSSRVNDSVAEPKQSSSSIVLAMIGTQYLSTFREISCLSGLVFIVHPCSSSAAILAPNSYILKRVQLGTSTNSGLRVRTEHGIIQNLSVASVATGRV